MRSQDLTASYNVIINDEEQYSIWGGDAQNPPGWRDIGMSGAKRERLDDIATVWTDMRPLSLRRLMDQGEASPRTVETTSLDDLLDRLSAGKHAVRLIRGRAIREDPDAGYMHLRFSRTAGGTELGIRLDSASCHYSRADLAAEVKTIRICGGLAFNSEEVRCAAEIELTALAGVAIFERLPA